MCYQHLPPAEVACVADWDALRAALQQERAEAEAAARALWQQMGAALMCAAAAATRASAVARGAARSSGAILQGAGAAALAGAAAAHQCAVVSLGTPQARAATLAAAAQLLAGVASAMGMAQQLPLLAAKRRAVAGGPGLLVQLVARARGAALLAFVLLRRALIGAGPASGYAQSAMLGGLLGHIPLVRRLVGRSEKRADAVAEWEWLRAAGYAHGGAQLAPWGGYVLPRPIAAAGDWAASCAASAATAAARAAAPLAAPVVEAVGCAAVPAGVAARVVQRVVLEPASHHAGAFYMVRRSVLARALTPLDRPRRPSPARSPRRALTGVPRGSRGVACIVWPPPAPAGQPDARSACRRQRSAASCVQRGKAVRRGQRCGCGGARATPD